MVNGISSLLEISVACEIVSFWTDVGWIAIDLARTPTAFCGSVAPAGGAMGNKVDFKKRTRNAR